jgi:hypothetical protein
MKVGLALQIGNSLVALQFGYTLAQTKKSKKRDTLLRHVEQVKVYQKNLGAETWVVNWMAESNGTLLFENAFTDAENVCILHVMYNKNFTHYTIHTSGGNYCTIGVLLLGGVEDGSHRQEIYEEKPHFKQGSKRKLQDEDLLPRKKIKSGTSVTTELYGTGFRFTFECPGTINEFKKRVKRAHWKNRYHLYG